MLYQEFLVLTDNQATYEQFVEIQDIYMSKESMTKKQAAALWRRRYGKKAEKPLPDYIRMFKNEIRNLKDNRVGLNWELEKIEKEYQERIKNLATNSYLEYFKPRFEDQKFRDIQSMYDTYSNESTIRIIYDDGTELIVDGTMIMTGEVKPKMQHIVYAMYEDGYCEYDTLNGMLVDWNTNFYGDLSTEEGVVAREEYFTMIDEKFGVKEIIMPD